MIDGRRIICNPWGHPASDEIKSKPKIGARIELRTAFFWTILFLFSIQGGANPIQKVGYSHVIKGIFCLTGDELDSNRKVTFMPVELVYQDGKSPQVRPFIESKEYIEIFDQEDSEIRRLARDIRKENKFVENKSQIIRNGRPCFDLPYITVYGNVVKNAGGNNAIIISKILYSFSSENLIKYLELNGLSKNKTSNIFSNDNLVMYGLNCIFTTMDRSPNNIAWLENVGSGSRIRVPEAVLIANSKFRDETISIPNRFLDIPSGNSPPILHHMHALLDFNGSYINTYIDFGATIKNPAFSPYGFILGKITGFSAGTTRLNIPCIIMNINSYVSFADDIAVNKFSISGGKTFLSDEALKLATKSYNDEMLKRINEVKAIFEHEAQIPAGTFQMGSLTDKNSRPVHSVTISKPFLMAKAPVTVGQFRAFVQGTGYKTEAEWDGGAYVWANGLWDKRIEVTWRNPGFAQQDDCPVVCVSWTDTQAYIKWLNNKNKDLNYRLPTEAEWEYACRAGTTDERYGDLNDIAWYHGNSGNRTNPVGGKKPNGFGLYDMQGNVWQWCQDGYADNYDEGGSFPKPQNGVIRGGGWGNGGQHVRSAYRAPASRSDRRNDLGFRVVAVPQNQ